MFKTLFSIVLLITSVTIFFMWTKPFYAEISRLGVEQKELNELLGNSKEIKQIRDDLNADYKSISSENIGRLSKLLPQQPDSIRFILEIEKVIKTNRMILDDITIAGPERDKVAEEEEKDLSVGGRVTFGGKKVQKTIEKVKPFEEIPLGMRVSGSYSSFYTFLGAAEKNLRLMEINSIKFSSGEEDFYEFDIGAVVYSKK